MPILSQGWRHELGHLFSWPKKWPWPRGAKAQMDQGSILIKKYKKVAVLLLEFSIVEILAELRRAVLAHYEGPNSILMKTNKKLEFY